MTPFKEKVNKLTSLTDRQERYSRRNCLLIHRTPGIGKENTDALAFNVFDKKMEMKIAETGIERSQKNRKTKV